jgi:hypothetical protein
MTRETNAGAQEATEGRVEVEVGRYDAHGTFTGEVVRFRGEEVGSYTDYSAARSRDDRGITYTLYRCPPAGEATDEPRYRVYVEEWSRWQGEDSCAVLHPHEELESPYEEPRYGSYTEAEARAQWGFLFAALGTPNKRDID